LSTGTADESETQAKVLFSRWIGKQYEPGHAWLDHQRLVVLQMDHHSLAATTNVNDCLISHSPVECIYAWLKQDRSLLAGRSLCTCNPTTNHGQDATTHRFDFWQLRQEWNSGGQEMNQPTKVARKQGNGQT
jgi:hypothetical protein